MTLEFELTNPDETMSLITYTVKRKGLKVGILILDIESCYLIKKEMILK